MKAVSLVLLIGVFLRHAGVRPIANWTGWTQAETFYILGGFWEVTLCLVLLLLCWNMRKCIWRSLIVSAMLIGSLEGMQVSVCRMAIKDIHTAPQGTDLCDHVTGLPIGISMMAFYILILAWTLGRATRAT